MELAVEVARSGTAALPPIDPPRSLRPILRFARLPASALVTVRKCIDEDDAFRLRIAAIAPDEATCGGRPGWLFVHRPEGWQVELTELGNEAAVAGVLAAEDAAERTARRRLGAAEDAVARAEDQLVRTRAELASVTTSLADERRQRRAAEMARDELATRSVAAERERDAAHRRASAADATILELRAALAEVASVPPPIDPEPESERTPLVPAEALGSQPGPGAQVPAAPFAVDLVRAAVAQAASAAQQLSSALGAAALALDPTAISDAGVEALAPRSRRSKGVGTAVRLPVPLPPGLFDDEAAAADHLVRVAGAVLVVDGYNASLRRWPDLPIAEQRRRLVNVLGGLAARRGVDVHVVFDGDEDSAASVAVAPRRGVRVTFSARTEEADDVIVDLVDRYPPARAVIVATDDRRVQRESAARGANVIGQPQLFALL